MGHGVLDLWDSMFKESKMSLPVPGEVVWVPVPTTDEVPRILQAERSDPSEHAITKFEIVPFSGKAHYVSTDRLPILKLKLGDREELLIAKSKYRPCIVLGSAVVPPKDIDGLQDASRRIAQHLSKAMYLVAPCYSVATPQEPGTFLPELVARIVLLKYVHLFCVTEQRVGAPMEPRSIVRLDHAFPTYLGVGCRRDGVKMKDEPLHILLSQVAVMLGSPPDEELKEIVGMLADVPVQAPTVN